MLAQRTLPLISVAQIWRKADTTDRVTDFRSASPGHLTLTWMFSQKFPGRTLLLHATASKLRPSTWPASTQCFKSSYSREVTHQQHFRDQLAKVQSPEALFQNALPLADRLGLNFIYIFHHLKVES